jgi:uncharacterized protein YbcI
MASDPTTPGRPSEAVDGTLLRISNEIVRAIKQNFGRGPERAKSYFVEDMLFVVMRGGLSAAEHTLLDAGRQDTVRQFRQEFQNVMAEPLTRMVEEITGRRVVNYQSQVLFDPDMHIEIFVFDDEAGPAARAETAQAIDDQQPHVTDDAPGEP